MSGRSTHAQAFLEDRLAQIERKAARLQSACDSCTSALERQGLRRMKDMVGVQRELVEGILADYARGSAASLEGLILYRLKQLQDLGGSGAYRWRCGQPTTAEYWQIEVRREALIMLLSRYRDWRTYQPDSAESLE